MHSRRRVLLLIAAASGSFAGCPSEESSPSQGSPTTLATSACAKEPRTGSPSGTASYTGPYFDGAPALIGAAAQIRRDDFSHDLKLVIGSYQNVCDYAAGGLGKEGASELHILLRLSGSEDFVAKTYRAGGGRAPTGVTIIPTVAPAGVRCKGDLFATLGEGTVTIESLTATRVKATFDLAPLGPNLPNLKGSVDAPICNGPKDSGCGCAK